MRKKVLILKQLKGEKKVTAMLINQMNKITCENKNV